MGLYRRKYDQFDKWTSFVRKSTFSIAETIFSTTLTFKSYALLMFCSHFIYTCITNQVYNHIRLYFFDCTYHLT